MNELALKTLLTDLSTRDKVNIIESELKKFDQLELEVKHYFSLDVYVRELYIPKDTILVGKIHKYTNLNIMTKGELSVLVGDEVQRVKAPFKVISPPGTKRIAYAHEDTIWMTILGTSETDVAKIENHFTAESEQDYIQFLALKDCKDEVLSGQLECS
jgi:hypothetical protein